MPWRGRLVTFVLATALLAAAGSLHAFDTKGLTAVLAVAQQGNPGFSGRSIVVFQPHLYTRTATFAREFGQALSEADEVFVLDVYAAREQPMAGVSGAIIADHVSVPVTYVPDFSAVAERVAAAANSGDVVVTMGAGDVTMLGKDASAGVPPALANAAVRAATCGVSARVTALAEGVLRTMSWTKLSTVAAALLTLTLGVGGLVLSTRATPATEPAEPAGTQASPADQMLARIQGTWQQVEERARSRNPWMDKLPLDSAYQDSRKELKPSPAAVLASNGYTCRRVSLAAALASAGPRWAGGTASDPHGKRRSAHRVAACRPELNSWGEPPAWLSPWRSWSRCAGWPCRAACSAPTMLPNPFGTPGGFGLR